MLSTLPALHSTDCDDPIIPEMKGPNSATIHHVGFRRNHRIMGFVILVFSGRALEISGAKKVHVHFTVPTEVGGKFRELALLWDCRKASQ